MENEIEWRAVRGYEGYYEVSSSGLLRSLPRDTVSPVRGLQKRLGRTLQPGIASNGYLTARLYGEQGVRKTCTIHSLIAEAFIGARPKGLLIDHIDGDRTNNTVTNLRYVSPAVNARNTTKCSGKSGVIGVYAHYGHWTAVIMLDGKKYRLGTYHTIPEAAAARKAFEEKVNYKGLQAA